VESRNKVSVCLQVLDYDLPKSPLIGEVSIELSEILDQRTHSFELTLPRTLKAKLVRPKEPEKLGKLFVEVRFLYSNIRHCESIIQDLERKRDAQHKNRKSEIKQLVETQLKALKTLAGSKFVERLNTAASTSVAVLRLTEPASL
jgi:hypothetical protein